MTEANLVEYLDVLKLCLETWASEHIAHVSTLDVLHGRWMSLSERERDVLTRHGLDRKIVPLAPDFEQRRADALAELATAR